MAILIIVAILDCVSSPALNSIEENLLIKKQFLEHVKGDHDRPYPYSRYWTGTSMQFRLIPGIF